MTMFRTATDVYGRDLLLGASWDLLWWFVGAAAGFIVLHLAVSALAPRRPAVPVGAGAGGRVLRHRLPDRLYHWTMAASMVVLLVTAFGPILGWTFAWVLPHWLAGLVLTAAIVFHLGRALTSRDRRSMIPAPADLAVTRLPGKYQLAQQLFHWAVAGLVLVLVASGLTMLVKIDSPLWRRNPYILSDGGWGLVTTVHDLGAMAVLALVLVHVYFALRPDKLWITRSMIRGWIRREDYLAHHDPRRWAGD